MPGAEGPPALMEMPELTLQPCAGWSTQCLPPHLHVREVLDLPGVVAATVDDGESTYLAVPVAGPDGGSWICAPASERALDCVRTRRASPWAVLHHSATGTVQVWHRSAGDRFTESVVPCADLRLTGQSAPA